MNAGLNILCYKSKTLSNGEHPFMFRVCKDGKKNKPKRNCPNKVVIEKLIAQKTKEFSELLLELEAGLKIVRICGIREKFSIFA